MFHRIAVTNWNVQELPSSLGLFHYFTISMNQVTVSPVLLFLHLHHRLLFTKTHLTVKNRSVDSPSHELRKLHARSLAATTSSQPRCAWFFGNTICKRHWHWISDTFSGNRVASAAMIFSQFKGFPLNCRFYSDSFFGQPVFIILLSLVQFWLPNEEFPISKSTAQFIFTYSTPITLLEALGHQSTTV